VVSNGIVPLIFPEPVPIIDPTAIGVEKLPELSLSSAIKEFPVLKTPFTEKEILKFSPSQIELLLNGKVLMVCACEFDNTKQIKVNPNTTSFFIILILNF
jgi:hypothetical protein